MTAKLQTQPNEFLNPEFDPETLHPADLSQILEAGWDYYSSGQISAHQRKKYREKFNNCVDILHEKRGYKIFNYLK